MLTAMGDVMREAYSRGWITTRDGNISVHRKPHCLYVTPTAVRKNKIEVEALVKMHVDNGELIVPPNTTPSIELDMHFNIHKDRGFVTGSVVHLHPTHCIAAMHRGIELGNLVSQFPELGRYTSVGRNVSMFDPGSDELAIHTAGNIKGSDIVGQIGHGVTAYALDPWSAFEHIERLEHICQMVLVSGV